MRILDKMVVLIELAAMTIALSYNKSNNYKRSCQWS